jgi:hypothetical protein
MKTCGGSGIIDPRFLDLGTSCRWVVSFTSRLLYPRGNSRRYPLDGLNGWAPEPICDDVERRKILPVPRLDLRRHGRPVRSQSLYQLRYPGSCIPSWAINEWNLTKVFLRFLNHVVWKILVVWKLFSFCWHIGSSWFHIWTLCPIHFLYFSVFVLGSVMVHPMAVP